MMRSLESACVRTISRGFLLVAPGRPSDSRSAGASASNAIVIAVAANTLFKAGLVVVLAASALRRRILVATAAIGADARLAIGSCESTTDLPLAGRGRRSVTDRA